jgi:hypothetical protein
MPPIKQLVQNQYPIKVPTFELEPILVVKGVLVQQTIITTTLFVNIPITTILLIYGNGVPIQQPKRVNSYP